jgi:hypothetical protein
MTDRLDLRLKPGMGVEQGAEVRFRTAGNGDG